MPLDDKPISIDQNALLPAFLILYGQLPRAVKDSAIFFDS
ncbi:uncharacterized protein METZ01_LOCUS18334 [marine metagenome]|uniref:Uncharacterized protein n=1 Tax=marine metagenome TaxID=408172 RepID=A0A381PEZ8_9ZZZZ